MRLNRLRAEKTLIGSDGTSQEIQQNIGLDIAVASFWSLRGDDFYCLHASP